MFETSKEMFSLMCEMAEEGVERARIKAQQNRILEVVRIDRRQLESVYAKIGRIDVTGVGKDKRDNLIEEAKKIEARILRAQVRYERLKEAASVDECTRAFEEKLSETIKSAKEAAGDKVEDIKDFVKDKSANLSGRIKEASQDFSEKATAKVEDLSIKAKDKAADISIKAKDKAEDIKAKAKAKTKDNKIKADDKVQKVAKDLDADEKVLDNVDDILKRIEDTINSVEEESAEEFKF